MVTPDVAAKLPGRGAWVRSDRAIIEQAIAHHDGHMSATARGLGMERSNLYKKCRTLGLRQDKDIADDEG